MADLLLDEQVMSVATSRKPLAMRTRSGSAARSDGCGVLARGDAGKRRSRDQRPLDDPDDWVRKKIVEPLSHEGPVVPILVNNARLEVERLPADLTGPVDLQYLDIRTLRQQYDIVGLAAHLVRGIPSLRSLLSLV
ncbi:hypothetical protein AB0N89_18095 [Amycolatopsis sp. NPDC089917]|uniref:hypothetical protein n=1 Tax=Amycolatopsis sp. NPDC089917 TaxID=3155187 RepID=UPI003446CD9B